MAVCLRQLQGTAEFIDHSNLKDIYRQQYLREGNVFINVCQEFCPWLGVPKGILGYTHPPMADTPL